MWNIGNRSWSGGNQCGSIAPGNRRLSKTSGRGKRLVCAGRYFSKSGQQTRTLANLRSGRENLCKNRCLNSTPRSMYLSRWKTYLCGRMTLLGSSTSGLNWVSGCHSGGRTAYP